MNDRFAGLRPLVSRPGDVVPKPKFVHLAPVRRDVVPFTPNPWGLTSLQCEVMRMRVAGKTVKEIGVVLCISHKTVNCHLEHAKEKMGVESLLQAALEWDRHFRKAEDEKE